MFDSVNIKEECEVVSWCRMSDIVTLKNIPFGVYAFTKPEERLPSTNIWPHEHMGIVYFGIAGKSYDDVYFDRKNKEDDTFHMSGQVYQRLRQHRSELGRSPKLFQKTTSYTRFFEAYGYNENNLDQINVCVMTPKKRIEELRVRSWVTMIESLSIYLYSLNFGYEPLMQVAHSVSASASKINEESHNQRKIRELRENSLVGFFND